jgi:Flp pilus assembly protein TadD
MRAFNGNNLLQNVKVFLSISLLLMAGCSSPKSLRDRGLALGKKWLEKGEYKRAVLEFRNAEQAMPRDAETHCLLGDAYAAGGALAQAAAEYKKAIESNPGHADAGQKLAALMTIFGDKSAVEEAEKRLHGLLDAAPADVTALNTLAYAELRLGKLDDAARHLEDVLAKSPKQLGSAVLLAEGKLAARDIAGAEEILKNAAISNANSPAMDVILGRFYFRLGRVAEAEQQFLHALQLDPANAPALFSLGILNQARGRKQQAEEEFRSLSRHPEKTYWPVYAMYLIQEGRKDEALTEFERLYQNDKEDRSARSRLVEAYLAANRSEDAERLITAALNYDSRDIGALLQRGELRLRDGHYGDAQMDLNAVLHENPNLPEAHFLQARIYEKNGAILNARQQLNESLRLDPLFLTARLALARVLVNTKAATSAIELLDETPGEQKADLAVLIERNWAYAASKDWGKFQQGVNRGLAIKRTSDLLVQDALWKFGRKDFAGARASAEEALRQAPGDVHALEALGLAWLSSKQPEAGSAKLQEYVARQPHSAGVQLFWSNWLLAKGDAKGAREALVAAKAAGADTTAVDLNLVRADLTERNWASARQKLLALIERSGGNVLARYWLAQVEEIQGNHRASEEQYRKVVAADPTNVKALNNLAYLLAEANPESSDAVSLAKRASDLVPEDPAVLDTLGWVLFRNGQYASAVRELERANMVQSTARRASHLSMAYLKTGAGIRAAEMFEQARKMDAGAPEVKKAAELLATSAATRF